MKGLISNIRLYFRTIRDLKPKQIFYLIRYKVIGFKKKEKEFKSEERKIYSFPIIEPYTTYNPDLRKFKFINQEVEFPNGINWNYERNGKLWLYNLNYFDFINQKNLSDFEILSLINSFNSNYNEINSGKEPYPTSLRVTNLVKLIANHNNGLIRNNAINILRRDIPVVISNLEYHLSGNHLLENAFALYFAAHVFSTDDKLVRLAKQLLKDELTEQILNDGGHYERSYMYHQVIYARLLESISLSIFNKTQWNMAFKEFLVDIAIKMSNWMNTISDHGQTFIRFNDSIEGISPDYYKIQYLAQLLNIKSDDKNRLDESGYEIWHLDNFFMIMNIGEITAKHQPGHAHADTLSFILNFDKKPLIVDPGISTYENNSVRHLQRSTSYHNTIEVNDINNNEVWSSFRVGKKARTKILKNTQEEVEVSNNGYKSLNITHVRKWMKSENQINIIDRLIGCSNCASFAFFHFHPSINPIVITESVILLNTHISLVFTGSKKIEIQEYDYCEGFNRTTKAMKAVITFENYLQTIISK